MADFDTILKSSYNLDTEEIFKTLDQYDLTDAQKGVLATSIILDHIGSSKRVFSYSPPLASAEAGCAPAFARSFVHADWQDGEDVVSAEGANGDEGFNARFHKIEDDLDALARDTAKSFECLAELRAALALALEQLRTEINRINADIFALRPSSGGTSLPPVIFPWDKFRPPILVEPTYPPVGPTPYPGTGGPYAYPGTITYPGNSTPFPEATPYPGFTTYPGYPGVFGYPGTTPVMPGMSGGTPTTLPDATTVWTSREDANSGFIAGMPAIRLTEGTFNGDKVELWQTPLGIFMAPVAVGTRTGSPGFVDSRLETTGRVSAWRVDKEAEVARAFGGKPFSKDDLVREFGDRDVGGGLRLKDALGSVPDSGKFTDLTEVVARLAETQASAINRAGAGTVATFGTVGLNPGAAEATAAPVEVFAAATPAERKALAVAGFKTVADLADAPTDRLAAALTGPADDAAAARSAAGRLQGIAMTLKALKG